MLNLGDFTTSDTVYVPLTTYDSDGASVTLTGLATTDIEIYKDGGTTQRSSDAGFALLDTDGIDFDSTTGLHGFSVDLSDNTDAGFYAAGSQYWLVVNAVTVDSQTVVICYYFTIGMVLKPTTAGRTLDVNATGEAGLDLDNTSGTIAAAQLAADCITEAKIADNAIATEHLADGAIGAATFAGNLEIGSATSERRVIEKDATDVSTYIMLYDTDGNPETGATTINFDLTYVRDGAAAAAKVDATGGSTTAHADNTVVEVDGTNMPGIYKVDWPDAAFATGVDRVCLYAKLVNTKGAIINVDLVDSITVDSDGAVDVSRWLGTACKTPTTAGVPEVDVTYISGDSTAADNLELACDNYSATRGLSGTALPAAAADAAGGLPISDAGGLDLDTQIGTDIDAILEDTGTTLPASIATAQTDLDTLTDTVSTDGLTGAPAETASLVVMAGYLYKAWRNKADQTSVLYQLYDDAGTTVDHKATVSESGGTVTRAEVETGP